MKELLRAAFVVARRDFVAILFSKAFLFFLLGPLFPVIVGVAAGGIGHSVQQSVQSPAIGYSLDHKDAAALERARNALSASVGDAMPRLLRIEGDPRQALADRNLNLAGVLTGTLDEPRFLGPRGSYEHWQGPLALAIADARADVRAPPAPLDFEEVRRATGTERASRVGTAQAGQMLLFLLTMLLAGMVLSNLVEEKGNKIIEILAAAVPMDAVFLGKLVAMLAISFVGIAVWGIVAGSVLVAGGSALPSLPEPAVGWSAFVALGVAYFALAYLLLGSLFLSIGSLATTVREVQTMSMPVTMMQLIVFLGAGFLIGKVGQPIEWAGILIPFASPFVMMSRAAQLPQIWPHIAAIGYQLLWVLVIVRVGSAVFRRNVMKSGPTRQRRGRRKAEPATAIAG